MLSPASGTPFAASRRSLGANRPVRHAGCGGYSLRILTRPPPPQTDMPSPRPSFSTTTVNVLSVDKRERGWIDDSVTITYILTHIVFHYLIILILRETLYHQNQLWCLRLIIFCKSNITLLFNILRQKCEAHIHHNVLYSRDCFSFL